jgi:O-antigen/teichoic acid export membrane protein
MFAKRSKGRPIKRLSDKISTAFNMASAIVTFVVQMAVSFFLSSYLVATVGEAATGYSKLANDFVSYASLITLAFNSMGQRFISAAYHKGESRDAAAYYSTLVVCNAVVCLAFLPVAAVVLANLQSIVDLGDADLSDVRLLFAFVFANFAINLFVSLFCSAMFVTNTLYIQNIINLARNVLDAALLVVMYSLFESRVSYVSFIALCLSTLSIPICLYFKRKLVPDISLSFTAFSGKFVGKLVSSGIWNSVNQCGHIMMTGLDLLLANWFVGAGPMGVLSIANTVPNAIRSLASAVINNLEPELMIAYAREGAGTLLARLRFDMRLSNLLVSVPTAVFCASSSSFYALWMPSLDAFQLAVLSFLSVANFVLWAGPQVTYTVFTVMDRLCVSVLSFLVGSALNVVAVLLLLNFTDAGLYAIAGTSTTIAIVRDVLIIAPYTSHLLGLPWYSLYKEMGVSAASFAASVLVTLGVSVCVGTGSWTPLVSSGVLSCVVSWGLVLVCTFSRDSRSRLFAAVKVKFQKG